MEWNWTLLQLAVSCQLLYVFIKAWQWYKLRGIPPGPTGLPFMGYAAFLGTNPQDKLLELSKTYGKIFSLYMGPQLAIILNDFSSIEAAFKGQSDTFAGRSRDFVFRRLALEADGKSHGITFHDGEVHKTARRFTIQTLKEIGLNRSSTHEKILREIGLLLTTFADHRGAPFDPLYPITVCCCNAVCVVCYGRQFDRDDPEFVEYLRGTELGSKVIAQANGFQSGYPMLRFLPSVMFPLWSRILETTRINRRFIHQQVMEHRASFVEGEVRDYTDAFLREQRRIVKNGLSAEDAFTDEELSQNLRGLIQGGTGTTAVTLQWMMLFMVNHPEVQKWIHRELDQHVERLDLVRASDRANLPYVEAVVCEVQRMANITPFGLLRTNTKETTLLGYRIPTRSFILPNFASINGDPALWAEPGEFKPERFLDLVGKLQKPQHFLPFSLGKRSCVGQSFAQTELFLVFSNIMHRFSIECEDSTRPPSSTERFTDGLCHPVPFKIRAIHR